MKKSKSKAKHNGFVITVTSPKGNPGKTTVSALLARQIAKSSEKAVAEGSMKRALKVCVVDLDVFDGGGIGYFLGVYKPTALDIALSPDTFSPELVSDNLIYSSDIGSHVLLAPVTENNGKHINAKFYLKVIDVLKSMFDFIILDTSTRQSDKLNEKVSFEVSDAILLISTVETKSMMGVNRWVNNARKEKADGGYGIRMGKVGIVINQSVNNGYITEDTLVQAADGVPLLVAVPMLQSVIDGYQIFIDPLGNTSELDASYFSLATKATKQLKLGFPVKLSPLS